MDLSEENSNMQPKAPPLKQSNSAPSDHDKKIWNAPRLVTIPIAEVTRTGGAVVFDAMNSS